MWIISSFGGELSPTVDHKLVFYFRWYTSSGELFFSSSPDLNYIPLVLFCDFIFGVSVAMAVMWVLLEHTRLRLESTFRIIVKSFQSLYQALLRASHSPPTN